MFSWAEVILIAAVPGQAYHRLHFIDDRQEYATEAAAMAYRQLSNKVKMRAIDSDIEWNILTIIIYRWRSPSI